MLTLNISNVMCSLRLNNFLESVDILFYQSDKKNLESMKNIIFSCNEHMEFNFKGRMHGGIDTAGCRPYVLVSVP